MSVKPIFILSLPRSGSTLLQRLLLGSGECATLGEPSLLLRFLGDDHAVARRSVYWEFLVSSAIRDMRAKWEGYDSAYYAGVRQLMESIYTGLAESKPWFIDKTPRYSLIASEIIKVFPEAKFIVLWRHPLAVAASMTAERGFWYPEEFEIDLYEGFERLHAFSTEHHGRIHELSYEALVSDPKAELQRLGDYLEWDQLEQVLDVPLEESNGGSLGDTTGVRKYSQVCDQSATAWHAAYSNWYRVHWARKYCRDRLEILQGLGYSLPDAVLSRSQSARLAAGARDWLLARNRYRRRYRSSISVKRYARQHLDQYGYGVSFR